MESIRNLQYLITVADEQSYSRAAVRLGVSQPTLSKQIKELETEFGHALFTRTTRRVELTAKGEMLYERAKSIVALYEQAKREALHEEVLAGDVRITLAETPAIASLIETIKRVRQQAPRVRVHLVSAAEDIAKHDLQTGEADFAVFVGNADTNNFATMKLHQKVHWGLLTKADGPLAEKTFVRARDLIDLPIFISEQSCRRNEFSAWFGPIWNDICITGSYNLVFNASLLAREGIAHVLCLDNIVTGLDEIGLKWLPLKPQLTAEVTAAWDKNRTFTAATRLFLSVWQEVQQAFDKAR
ncbi:MAG: LysR family transcriptional regulator [Sutterellaceae bacterium]|nr:LysR family transcriptional regulator [Sutterellaceae bacterium]